MQGHGLNRRGFLKTTATGALFGVAGWGTIGSSSGAEADPLTEWPVPGALLNGVLRPLQAPVPSPHLIFGKDPRAMIREALVPPTGEARPMGSQHAAFILPGLQKARGSTARLPMMKAGNAADATAFYVRLLAPVAPITMAGRSKCPFCQKAYTGLTVKQVKEAPCSTACCGKTVEDAGQGGEINFSEEIAFARVSLLFDHLGGLIYGALEHDDASARRILVALVCKLPEVLDAQPWLVAGGRARRGDFPKGSLPETPPARSLTEIPTKEELAHFEAFCAEAPIDAPELKPVFKSANDMPTASLYRLIADHAENALLAEAAGTVWKELDEASRKAVGASLRRQFCLIRHIPQMRGNFPGYCLPLSLSIAIGSGDQAYYDYLLEFYRDYMHNHFYTDGMSVEGAFNYGRMVGWICAPGFRNRLGATVWEQMCERRPLLSRISDVGAYPVRTMLNIESQHGDEHLSFFGSQSTVLSVAPDYARTERSELYPCYGIACLRGGGAGSRVETILDFQPSVLHAHPAKMNLQFFFEGLSLLPELGYAGHGKILAPTEVPEALRKRCPPIAMRPWFNDAHEAHCSATIDGHLGNDPNAVIRAYYAHGDLNAPGASFRFIQLAMPAGSFADLPGKIHLFDRQLMVVTLPSGSAIAISVFHLGGGGRHDVYWHAPAPVADSSLGLARREDVPHLFQYLQQNVPNPPPYVAEKLLRKNTFALIHGVEEQKLAYGEDARQLTGVRTWDVADLKVWNLNWTVTPSHYVVDREPEPCLKPAHLRMWCAQNGSPAAGKCIGSRAPWPAVVSVGKYRSGVICRDEALDVIQLHRHSRGDGPLESCFVNVLAPSAVDAPCPLRDVEVLANEIAPAHQGTAVVLSDSENRQSVVMSTIDGGRFSNATRAFELVGRTGMVSPASHAVVLCDGTKLRASGYSLELAGGQELPLAGLVGDLTGRPAESALLLKLATPLPQILVGTYLFVDHATGEAHRSSYQIAKISAIAEGLQRIDLAGSPPFALAIYRINAVGPTWVGIPESTLFPPNRPISNNRRAYFPGADFKAVQTGAKTGGSSRWATVQIHFDRKLPTTLKPGDPLILYSIQPGDRVRIPSAFACRRIGHTLAIESTGAAELVIPQMPRPGPLPHGVATTVSGNTTLLKISSGRFDLPLI